MKVCQFFDGNSAPIEGKFNSLKKGIYRRNAKGWFCLPSGSKIWMETTRAEAQKLSGLARETGASRLCVVLVSEKGVGGG